MHLCCHFDNILVLALGRDKLVNYDIGCKANELSTLHGVLFPMIDATINSLFRFRFI